MFKKQQLPKYLCILFCLGCVWLTVGIVHGAKNDKADEIKSYAINEAELQAQIMDFVDLFTVVMTSAFRQSDALLKTRKNQYELQAMVTYTLYNAYIIAGESKPAIALLDMLSMVSLGRIIFEEEGQKLYGVAVQPIIQGFRKAENEIQKIAVKVLREDQLENVMSIIRSWRNNNPEITFFQFTRFNHIAGERRKVTPDDQEKPDGIFETVESATEQVEEVRLLAERGIYLATRLPQFWTAFWELGMSKLFENPDLKTALENFSLLSQVSNRLTTAAETLSEQIAVERKVLIKQAMEIITKERKMAIDHFVDELSAERKAAIVQSMEGIAKERQLAFDQLIDIVSTERKAAIDDVLTKAEKQSKALVDYTMRWLIAVVAIWFVGYVAAKVLLRVVPQRRIE